MKITLFSNFINHHQLPLCCALCNHPGVDFTFVQTERIAEERLKMGYPDLSKAYPFVLCTYDSEDAERKAENLAAESDVVIIGSAPKKYATIRLKEKKLMFFYSERLYKTEMWRAFLPKERLSIFVNHTFYRNRPVYMLCASAYTALDYGIHGAYFGKTFKWGYFPETKHYDLDDLMSQKQSTKDGCVSILWAGRLIDMKHPETAVNLADALRRKGYTFKLSIIGNGSLEDELKATILEKNLSDHVEMLGAMPPEKVRGHMEKADIFLFTSDFGEGWGAVLNESMNSGCAVVASHAIGSVPFLIKHRENGMIYHSGNMDELYEHVKYLLDHPAEQKRMGQAAYETIVGEWNAEIAAERLVQLAEHLLSGEKYPDLFESGPCSRAKILKDDWY